MSKATTGEAELPRDRAGVCALAALATVVALACTGGPGRGMIGDTPEEELALKYNRAAQYHGPDRNPIIVIPGLLGTRLIDAITGRVAWGAFDAMSPGSDDRAVELLGLPIDDEVSVEELADGLRPDGVLERIRIRLAGIPIEVEAYARILATLGAGGYRDEALGLGGVIDYGDDHFTCFQFAYDWRLDNVANARRLHRFVLEKRALVQEAYRERYGVEQADVRFDIAAHSMGGLVTRWFLRYGSAGFGPTGEAPAVTWEGARYVDRAILIATPNAGSVEALDALVRGDQLAPLLATLPPALIGTFPSAYQLLPRTRHGAAVWDGDAEQPVDLLDPSVWEGLGWGLAAQDQDGALRLLLPGAPTAAERRRLALGLQRRMLARAAAFHAALDTPATAPERLELFLVAGGSEPTPRRVSVSASGDLRIVAWGPGDGTVLRASALLDERMALGFRPQVVTPVPWRSILFLPEDHLGVTKSPVFRDNVLFWLLEAPRSHGWRAPELPSAPGPADRSASRIGQER